MGITSIYPPDGTDDSATTSDIFGVCARLLGGLLVAFVIVGCVVVSRRGPWLDEFWSLWQSQHDLPLGEIIRQRWMADFNPPMFSLIHWTFSPLIGDSLVTHRLLNFVGLAWAALFSAVAIKRAPHRSGFIFVFAAILLSLPMTMLYLAEMRSYFFQACCYYVLVTAAVLIVDTKSEDGSDLNWSADRVFALMTMATFAAAINLHYVSTLLASLLLIGLVALCFLRRWIRWGATIAVTGIVSIIPLIWYLFEQLPFLLKSAKDYWLHETMTEAASTLLFTAVGAIRSNSLVLLIGMLSIMVSLGMQLPATRRLMRAQGATILDGDFKRHLVLTRSRGQVCILLFGVLAAFAIAMLVASIRQPMVSERYLLNFEVVSVGLIACLASEALASRRLLLILLLASALFAMINNGRKVAREERWNATAQKVVEFTQACRKSAIYAGVIKRPTFSKNEFIVHEWAFARLAQRHGLGIQYIDLGPGRLPDSDKTCPKLLWVEHVDWTTIRPRPTAEELLRLLGLETDALDVARAELYTSDSGFVLRLPAK